MITLVNEFHVTKTEIRAKVGESVSLSTVRRVHKELCGVSGCQCSGADGTRGGEYHLALTPGEKKAVVEHRAKW